jgi:hypothetical protein
LQRLQLFRRQKIRRADRMKTGGGIFFHGSKFGGGLPAHGKSLLVGRVQFF